MIKSKRNYVLDWQTGIMFLTDKNYRDLVDGMTAAWNYLTTDTQITGPDGKGIDIDKRIYMKDLYNEFLGIDAPYLDGSVGLHWNRIVTSQVKSRNDLMVEIEFIHMPWDQDIIESVYVVRYPYAYCFG